MFFPEVTFTGAGLAIMAILLGALTTTITILFKAQAAANDRTLAAKDAHIKAAETIIAENSIALKGVMGALDKLDEHLEAAKELAQIIASRSHDEHTALMQSARDLHDEIKNGGKK